MQVIESAGDRAANPAGPRVSSRRAVAEADEQSTNALLWRIIRRVRFALLVTHGIDGMLHAQPLTTHNREATADNLLYFLVSPRSAAAVDLRGGSSRVVVMYADPEYDRYACISGPARIWRDPDLQTQLLSVFAPAHFPIRNDLELQLIAVRIEAVNFSDARTVSAALET